MQTIGQSTWGITGPQFLVVYGALAATCAIWIATRWHGLLGPRPASVDDSTAEVGLHDLALLCGGPQLAITSAASQLHRDRSIASSPDAEALEAVGEIDETADPLERAVYEVVRDETGITASAMRERVADADALALMTAQLTCDGLLVEPAATRGLTRALLAFVALLALLGGARIIAGVDADRPVGLLVVIVAAIVLVGLALAARTPATTRRGRAVLEQSRERHADLRSDPVGAEFELVAALFGGATLWLAAPEVASALGVEREGSRRYAGNSGVGCGGGACGGCGGCG